MGFLSRDEIEAIGFSAFGGHVFIDSTARFYGAERISIGSNVRIDAYAVLSAGRDGISIGNYVHIGVGVFMTGSAHIELQDFVGVSTRVSIFSSNDDYYGNSLTGPTVPEDLRKLTIAPVALEKHVIVGAGSIILPGVTLKTGAAVGALTLVKRNVAAFTIIAGPKGQVIGKRSQELLRLEQQLLSRRC
jgi:acetyltransferase-like isoleucine patch superfamily enzyme